MKFELTVFEKDNHYEFFSNCGFHKVTKEEVVPYCEFMMVKFAVNNSDGGELFAPCDVERRMRQHLIFVKPTKANVKSKPKFEFSLRPSGEVRSIIFRRSIYVVKDMKQGERFSEENIRVIRPCFGLWPKNWWTVLKLKSSQDLKRGTALQWSYCA